jgi:hypothetical protein
MRCIVLTTGGECSNGDLWSSALTGGDISDEENYVGKLHDRHLLSQDS